MEFSRTALDTSTTLLGLRLNNVTRYLGIPYAEPPVGDRRFRPPAPLSLSGLVNATAHGPWCPQLAPGATGDVLGDEDNCLTLNVYVPDNLPPKAPVLVWIHGGGLMTGAAPLYNLSALAAAGGAVGVTVQYRLNALGFLAAPGLASVGAGGNLGVADQVAALKWVNTHAAAFGADATRVTVLGQSAGGTSVLLLAAAPPARGLFARAVAQSPWWAGRLIAGIDTATAARKVWSGCVGDANATAAGGDAPAPLCAKESGDELLSCLQAAPIADVLGACGDVVAVTTDGGVLDASTPTPMESMCANAEGEVANAPFPGLGDGALLVGSTVDEYRYWAMGYASSAEAAAALESSTREHIGTYLALDLDLVAGAQVTPNATWGAEQATCAADYVLRKAAEAYSTHKPLPLSHADVDADAKQAAAEMMVGDSAAAPSILSAEQAAALVTDAWFTAPAALAAGSGGGGRWRYVLDAPVATGGNTTVALGTIHCADLPYVLGFDGFVWRYNTSDSAAVRDYYHAPTPAMERTRDAVQRAWVSFAADGKPEHDGWQATTDWRGEPHVRLHGGGEVEVSTATVSTAEGVAFARRLHCDRDAVRAEVIDHCAHPPGDDHHLLLAASDADRRRGRRADDHSLLRLPVRLRMDW